MGFFFAFKREEPPHTAPMGGGPGGVGAPTALLRPPEGGWALMFGTGGAGGPQILGGGSPSPPPLFGTGGGGGESSNGSRGGELHPAPPTPQPQTSLEEGGPNRSPPQPPPLRPFLPFSPPHRHHFLSMGFLGSSFSPHPRVSGGGGGSPLQEGGELRGGLPPNCPQGRRSGSRWSSPLCL